MDKVLLPHPLKPIKFTPHFVATEKLLFISPAAVRHSPATDQHRLMAASTVWFFRIGHAGLTIVTGGASVTTAFAAVNAFSDRGDFHRHNVIGFTVIKSSA